MNANIVNLTFTGIKPGAKGFSLKSDIAKFGLGSKIEKLIRLNFSIKSLKSIVPFFLIYANFYNIYSAS